MLCRFAATTAKIQINAAVALGCVIRGDTYHFDIVANEIRARNYGGAISNWSPRRQRNFDGGK